MSLAVTRPRAPALSRREPVFCVCRRLALRLPHTRQRTECGSWWLALSRATFSEFTPSRSFPRLNDVDCAAHQILKLHSQWVLGWLPPSPSRVTPLRASDAGCCVKMCSSLRRNLLGVGSPALAGCGGRAHGARCPRLLPRGGRRLPLRPQAPQTRVCVRGPQPHPSGPATLTERPRAGPVCARSGDASVQAICPFLRGAAWLPARVSALFTASRATSPPACG